jgi:hypothetical protein
MQRKRDTTRRKRHDAVQETRSGAQETRSSTRDKTLRSPTTNGTKKQHVGARETLSSLSAPPQPPQLPLSSGGRGARASPALAPRGFARDMVSFLLVFACVRACVGVFGFLCFWFLGAPPRREVSPRDLMAMPEGTVQPNRVSRCTVTSVFSQSSSNVLDSLQQPGRVGRRVSGEEVVWV